MPTVFRAPTTSATERLLLRRLVPEHAGSLFPVIDDERLHEFTGGHPYTIEELRARLEVWEAERSLDGREAWLNWLVLSRSDDRVLGTMQATVERGPDGAIATVAWTVGADDQGKGVASEAAAGAGRSG